MQGLARTETELPDVIGFEKIEDLQRLDATRARRRRPDDLDAAIEPPDRLAVDRAIGHEIFEAQEGSGLLEMGRDALAERTAIDGVGPLGRDLAQRSGIILLDQQIAGLQRLASGQEDGCDPRIEREVRRDLGDAGGQIGREPEAALGVADRRFDQVAQRQAAEALGRFAPGFECARHGDGLRPDPVGAASGLHVIGPPVRDGRETVGTRRRRRGRETIEDDLAPVRQPDQGDAAAEDADHHRLDHRQREESRDRGIDRVAAGCQHLDGCSRSEWVVGHRHAAMRGDCCLLADEGAARPIAPIHCHEPDADDRGLSDWFFKSVQYAAGAFLITRDY